MILHQLYNIFPDFYQLISMKNKKDPSFCDGPKKFSFNYSVDAQRNPKFSYQYLGTDL